MITDADRGLFVEAARLAYVVCSGHSADSMTATWVDHRGGAIEATFTQCPGGYMVRMGVTLLVCTPQQFEAVLDALRVIADEVLNG